MAFTAAAQRRADAEFKGRTNWAIDAVDGWWDDLWSVPDRLFTAAADTVTFGQALDEEDDEVPWWSPGNVFR